ncbi:MAG TPA: class I adenylate-forming enzyme family protein [Verrucomicrobiae bacterium]|nr:class I adenylate-forming enzyme family protein [Verrucomicrobiae bacterium]
MLYESWRRTARSHPDHLALWDLAQNHCWTFAQLVSATVNGPRAADGIAFPSGASVDFVFSVLRAWRSGQVVCPLEPDQERPQICQELPREVVHLKTTSATTGVPRLVAFTAAQLAADAQNIVGTMGLRPDWPNLGVISLAHSYGFSNLVLPLLLHGIPLILAGSALPEAIRRASEGHPAITLAAVPALWQTWQQAGVIPSNIRLAISAGAPLPLALEQNIFARHGLKLHNFYGSSECGGIAYDATTEPRRDAACAGTPLRNVQVSIAQDGCIEARGQAVGWGYWPEPAGNLCGGVFRSGDLGEISEGRVYLRGRATDQINVAGRKVLPEAIEKVLAAHPHVRACLAFGVPSADTQRGETIVACVAGNPQVTGESLKQFAMDKLPAWQVPRKWWLVDSLDTNHRGKISRAEWRKRFLEKAGGGKDEV